MSETAVRPAGLAADRPSAKAAGWLADAPLVATVAVLFVLSGGVLWDLGLNYEGLTGSPASKIHPGTYLLILLFAYRAATAGNPFAYLADVGARRPASLFLVVVGLVTFGSIAARGAPGLAGVIDTYIGAGLLVMLLADADLRTKDRIADTIHVIMAVNALMGIAEFAIGMRVFPYRFDGEVFPTDLRSTALQGHPLNNAFVASCYVLALAAGARLRIAPRLRLPLIGLQAVSLITFGGRTGLVLALVIGSVLGFRALLQRLRAGRIPLLGAAAFVALLTLVPVAVAALSAGGFFTAILDRFQDDGGSAYARVQMFDLFDGIPTRDLIFGPDAALVDSLRRIDGLEWGIENPIIRTLLYHGIIVTALLTIGVIAYLTEVVRLSGPGTLAPMLGFIILTNTAETLGGKTTLLTKFAVTLICFFPRELVTRPWLPASRRR